MRSVLNVILYGHVIIKFNYQYVLKNKGLVLKNLTHLLNCGNKL